MLANKRFMNDFSRVFNVVQTVSQPQPRISECKEHDWKYRSGRRVAAGLFRNSYECQECGGWKTITEESPNNP